MALLALICVALALQLPVLLFTRGPAAMWLPKRFHAVFARILGLQVEYTGEPVEGAGVVHLSNHLSYLDVQVLGRRLRTRFVAKEDVRAWPLFGLLARVQQTLFITRARQRAGEAGAMVSAALDGPHGLLLFPEGTTSDGSGVLPFRAGAFAPLAARPGLLLQPVRIELLAADGRAIDAGGDRDVYAYHGDATLLPHLWRFLRGSGARVRVRFLPPLRVGEHADRKRLARETWASVANQASAPVDVAVLA